jgi:hypothetical protein
MAVNSRKGWSKLSVDQDTKAKCQLSGYVSWQSVFDDDYAAIRLIFGWGFRLACHRS